MNAGNGRQGLPRRGCPSSFPASLRVAEPPTKLMEDAQQVKKYTCSNVGMNIRGHEQPRHEGVIICGMAYTYFEYFHCTRRLNF